MVGKKGETFILKDVVRPSTLLFIISRIIATFTKSVTMQSNLVTGSCNTNFTQYRHLRYLDKKVTIPGVGLGSMEEITPRST